MPPEAPVPVLSTTRTSPKTTSAAGSTAKSRTCHLVLQGKGGVGKTLVASILAQYLDGATCWDTDPVNSSFAAIKALGARVVPILRGRLLNVAALDALLDEVLNGGDTVIDSGAASFVPLSDYLLKSDIPALAADAGCTILAHVALTGGASKLDTLSGLRSVLTTYPASVRVVVWVNEFFGPFGEKPFAETVAYSENKDRIAGVVTLGKLDPELAGWNVARMLEERQTFAEAIDAADVVAKSRLWRVKREIWGQLEGVL